MQKEKLAWVFWKTTTVICQQKTGAFLLAILLMSNILINIEVTNEDGEKLCQAIGLTTFESAALELGKLEGYVKRQENVTDTDF